MKYSKELIIEKIIERSNVSKSLSHQVTVSDDEALIGAARRYLGSWGNAIEAAGFNYAEIKASAKADSNTKRLPPGHWSEARIIDLIKEMYSRGDDLNPHAVQNKDSKVYASAVYYFGSWGKAVNAAGIDYLEHRKTSEWDADSVIDRIKFLHNKGVELSDTTVNYLNPALYSAANTYFESWKKAIIASGFDYSEESRTVRWSKQKVIEYIHSLKSQGIPITDESNSNNSFKKAAARYYGSVAEAVNAAGYGETGSKNVMIRNRLREIRESRGLSQEELGLIIGYSHRYIGMIELRQIPNPRLNVALLIAKALNVPFEDIFYIKQAFEASRA